MLNIKLETSNLWNGMKFLVSFRSIVKDSSSRSEVKPHDEILDEIDEYKNRNKKQKEMNCCRITHWKPQTINKEFLSISKDFTMKSFRMVIGRQRKHLLKNSCDQKKSNIYEFMSNLVAEA
ncbi:CLUMA_CG000369, isoform A [Clunio marinus]|uniref:CLUMA_CG000369, isoform A n=1 Tax=Clunio marinus TaxID=568069 RepID=A0A1J1HFK0_9DIPT|nr:CLUMA_CG000369, isoform A [Clunio marinus]